MHIKTFAVCLMLLFASFVSAEDCITCHAIPSDSSHKTHASAEIVPPAYGNTGHTYQYAKISESYGFNCGNCHPQDLSSHGNGTIDIELYHVSSKGHKKMNRQDAVFDKSKKTCNGVYCHSSGEQNSFIEFRETPAWGSSFGYLRCQGCHGTPPSYQNQKGRENSHFNTERGSGHLLGIHWDATKGHTKESFKNRSSTDMGCSTCHYSTVSEDRDTTFVDRVAGLFTCSRCHDGNNAGNKNRPGVISNKALHVNGIVEVSFNPGKFRTTARLINVPQGWSRTGKYKDETGYDETIKALNSAEYVPKEKKCINVACHLLGTEVAWGDAVECDSCHKDFLFRKP